jgi:hypothetical protein
LASWPDAHSDGDIGRQVVQEVVVSRSWSEQQGGQVKLIAIWIRWRNDRSGINIAVITVSLICRSF